MHHDIISKRSQALACTALVWWVRARLCVFARMSVDKVEVD